MIEKAMEQIEMKGGTMAFILTVIVALFVFYNKDEGKQFASQADERLEDKIEVLEGRVSNIEGSRDNILINKTRIEQNHQDIEEVKAEIRFGFDKLENKLDELFKPVQSKDLINTL